MPTTKTAIYRLICRLAVLGFEKSLVAINMTKGATVPKLASRASRKHGFEGFGLKPVLWRISLRSAKIF